MDEKIWMKFVHCSKNGCLDNQGLRHINKMVESKPLYAQTTIFWLPSKSIGLSGPTKKLKIKIKIKNQVYFLAQFELCQSELNSTWGNFSKWITSTLSQCYKFCFLGKEMISIIFFLFLKFTIYKPNLTKHAKF